MTAPISITEAMHDKSLFGGWLGGLETWRTWTAILKATNAEPLTDAERTIFAELAGGRDPPTEPVRELWVIAGRRSGKSAIAAMLGVHAAAICDHRQHMRAGEVATIPIIAADRAQSRTVLRYAKAILSQPIFRSTIARATASEIELRTGATIEIGTCSGRSSRGYSCPAVICDETAFWRSETSSDPDVEVINALRPTQATFPQPLLVAISSPYSRKGALWQAYRRSFGKNDPRVLVIQGPTTAFNPTIDRAIIDAALEEDPAAAGAEWLGQFRSDIEAFISRESIDAVVIDGRYELPPAHGTHYVGFVDPSGGAQDSYCLAIGHRNPDGAAVLDLVRERKPPFSPDAITAEYAAVLKTYGLSSATGDYYGAEWVAERFREHSIRYDRADRPKSAFYQESLALINSRRVELLDHTKLVAQLCGLERRTSRGGKDSIDHASGQHDDIANVACGVLATVAAGSSMETWKRIAENAAYISL